MPVAFVDSSGAGSSASTTAVSVTKPAGLVSGNFIVATISASGSDLTMSAAPASLTLLDAGTQVSPVRRFVYTGFAGGSEPATYDWTLGVAGNWSCVLQCYSGVSTVTPRDVFATSDNASSTALAVAALNNTGTDDYQVACLAHHSGSTTGTTYTFPTGVGWGNQATQEPSSTTKRNAVMASRQLSAEDPATFDVTSSLAGGSTTLTLALNVAVTDTTPPAAPTGLTFVGEVATGD